jgi:UDP-GlcNAc:undecaprenyl-phosphate GlcNAc-1-phosphate transferase
VDPWQLIVPFVVACAVAAMSTPVVSMMARQIGAVDRPNDRKVSRRDNMPLLGGLAVAMGCSVALAVVVIGLDSDSKMIRQFEGFLMGGFVLLAVGMLDDRWSLSAWPKLLGQMVAAGIAIHHGYVIEYFREPFTAATFDLPYWLGAAFTMFWIVAVSNAINLIDGLDGLATGVGAIIAVTLTVICAQAEQPVGVVLGLVLAGSLLGFLPFNFAPARIFLGDTGALFIGYALSLIALEGYLGGYRKASLMAFLVPMLALAVPLLDTLLSIIRRARAGQKIFSADRQHMHHRLLESEGSDRGAVLSLYFLTACFCVIAVSFTKLEGYAAFVFLAAVVLLTVRLMRNLGVHNLEVEPEANTNDVSDGFDAKTGFDGKGDSQ